MKIIAALCTLTTIFITLLPKSAQTPISPKGFPVMMSLSFSALTLLALSIGACEHWMVCWAEANARRVNRVTIPFIGLYYMTGIQFHNKSSVSKAICRTQIVYSLPFISSIAIGLLPTFLSAGFCLLFLLCSFQGLFKSLYTIF